MLDDVDPFADEPTPIDPVKPKRKHAFARRPNRRINEKQQKLLDGIAAGKPLNIATQDAGYASPRRALALMEKEPFFEHIQAAFEKKGITLDRIAEKVSDGLEATTVEFLVTRDGVVKTEPVPDYMARHKYVGTAADLLGLSSRARASAHDTESGGKATINIIQLAQKFEHLDDKQLEEAMQLQRAGIFEGSIIARQLDAPTIVTGEDNDNQKG